MTLKDMVQRGELEGGIVIPSNFSESIMTGQQGTLIIVSDKSNPQISATIQGALSDVFDAMGTAACYTKGSATERNKPTRSHKPYNVQTQGVVSGTQATSTSSPQASWL